MHTGNMLKKQRVDLETPVRNRYFYGKLLDVHHFELETNYLNAKRWLLNRLVSGYGVICGLDVQLCNDKKSIIVQPGVAIDKWGREIIVSEPSKPERLPDVPGHTSNAEAEQQEPQEQIQEKACNDGNWVHVDLCFHECESDPVPVLAGDCKAIEVCAPGAIQERYKIVIKEGKVPKVNMECAIPDLISGDHINYPALAIHVTRPCGELPEDSCISLANVQLKEPYNQDDIDITVRPIVYTNDLLFELLCELTAGEKSHPRGGKP